MNQFIDGTQLTLDIPEINNEQLEIYDLIS